MANEEQFPRVPRPLVEFLDKHFPNQCPNIDMTERKIFFYAGERAIVDLLKFHLEDQEKPEDVPSEA